MKQTEIKADEFIQQQKHATLEGIVDIPVDIAYTDIGSGYPLLLLHGIPTWSYLYHNVIDQLAKKFRVIAPDFLGHGSSDLRDVFDRSIVVQSKVVLKLMDYLGLEKAHIAGHDTGGGVSLILAINHPQRINRLVLSNIVAYDSWPIDDMLALGNPEWITKPINEIADFLKEGFELGLSRPETLTKYFIDGIRQPYLTEEGKISLIRNASSLNTNHTTNLIHRHKNISAETLVLWGVDDPWQTIRDGERLAEEIPNARLVRLENVSHWLQQDAPDEYVFHLLEFLKA